MLQISKLANCIQACMQNDNIIIPVATTIKTTNNKFSPENFLLKILHLYPINSVQIHKLCVWKLYNNLTLNLPENPTILSYKYLALNHPSKFAATELHLLRQNVPLSVVLKLFSPRIFTKLPTNNQKRHIRQFAQSNLISAHIKCT